MRRAHTRPRPGLVPGRRSRSPRVSEVGDRAVRPACRSPPCRWVRCELLPLRASFLAHSGSEVKPRARAFLAITPEGCGHIPDLLIKEAQFGLLCEPSLDLIQLPLEKVGRCRTIRPPPVGDGESPTPGSRRETDLQRAARSSANTSSASTSCPALASAIEASSSRCRAARSSSSK